jgi:hypothetical protein
MDAALEKIHGELMGIKHSPRGIISWIDLIDLLENLIYEVDDIKEAVRYVDDGHS